MRRLFRSRRLRLLVALVPAAALSIAIGAYAYWTAIGIGSVTGGVAGLTSPSPTASSATPGTAHVSWSAVTLDPPVPAVDSEVTYTVERKLSSGSSWTYVCGTGTTPKAHDVLDCDDSPPATEDYDYRVVGHFRSWTAAGTASVHVTVDTDPPDVVSIVRGASTQTTAATVQWTVTFSEDVAGVDASDFSLVGTGTAGASVTGVSGGGDTYGVEATTGADGTLRLDLVDDDTIVDGAGNRLSGSGAGNGNFTGEAYDVDRTAPSVSSIVRAGANPTNAGPLAWTVTFSEPVSGVSVGNFALTTASTGGSAPTVSSAISGGAPATTWTVTASTSGTTGQNSGSIRLDLTSAGSIQDAATNALAGTATGQAYTYDTTAPSVSSIVRADPNPTSAATVSWTVTFNEGVTGVGVADFALAATGPTGTSVTGVSGGPTVFTVTASTGTGTGTLGLNLVDDDSVRDGVGNALGGAGTGNGNFTGQVFTVSPLPVITASCPVDGGSYGNANSGAGNWNHKGQCDGTFTVSVQFATTVTVSLRQGGGLCWNGSASGSAFTAACPNQVSLSNASGTLWSRDLDQGPLTDGSYTAVVTATNASGTVTLTISFTMT